MIACGLADEMSLSTRCPVHRLPPSPRAHLLDYGLQVLTIVASRCISPIWLDDGLQVHWQTRSSTASICFYTLARWWAPSASASSLDHSLQVYLYTRPITACKFTGSRPPSESANPLDHGLGVYLWVYSIVIFWCTLTCSQSLPAASPDIPCVDG